MLSPNVPFELRTDRLDASWQTPQLSTDDLELHAAVGEHLPRVHSQTYEMRSSSKGPIDQVVVGNELAQRSLE